MYPDLKNILNLKVSETFFPQITTHFNPFAMILNYPETGDFSSVRHRHRLGEQNLMIEVMSCLIGDLCCLSALVSTVVTLYASRYTHPELSGRW